MEYNHFAGKIILNASTENNGMGSIATPVALLQDAPALTCLVVIDECGTSVNADYSNPVAGRPAPMVDAITLQAGKRGDTVLCAMCWGQRYRVETPLSDAPLPGGYFLGRDSLMTPAPPAARWRVSVARWVNDREFIFAPQLPVDTTAPGPGPTPDPSAFTVTPVVLGAPMAANSPFQFGPAPAPNLNPRAYPVLPIEDEAAPFVHGIILESGGVGDTRNAATMSGVLYKAKFPFEESGIHFLSKDGKLTKTIPNRSDNGLWNCVVVNVLNRTHFVLVYQPPIFLRRS